MNYHGIDINVNKNRYIERISIEGLYGRTKDVVVIENIATMRLYGLTIQDPAFIFEFHTILEEFINKKLGPYKEETCLNSITQTDNDEFLIRIFRKENLLLALIQDYSEEVQGIIELDVLKAKTVFSMLHKAIHTMDL
jgi:hypothetical protein